jgi:hypothetical protein
MAERVAFECLPDIDNRQVAENMICTIFGFSPVAIFVAQNPAQGWPAASAVSGVHLLYRGISLPGMSETTGASRGSTDSSAPKACGRDLVFAVSCDKRACTFH